MSAAQFLKKGGGKFKPARTKWYIRAGLYKKWLKSSPSLQLNKTKAV